MKSRWMTLSLAAAAVLALLFGASPAAQAAPAASGPAGFIAGFATPVVVISQGEGVTFFNFDIAPHDFVALDAYLSKRAARKTKWCTAFEGRCPLFWSPRIGIGQSADVLGLDALKAGDRHRFYCTLHHNMVGTLVVR